MRYATAPALHCPNCPIADRAICSICGPEELKALDTIKTYRSYTAGTPIAWAGESVDYVGSVVTGCAGLSRSLEDGRRQMVGLLLPSDFMGRPSRPHSEFDVTAATDLVMCCFERKKFDQLLSRTPALERRLLEMTFDELDAARHWMLLLGRKTARERLASFLAILARRTAAGLTGPVSFELPLAREAMADYLGLTIETVSRQVSALRRDGLIDLVGKRQVDVPDLVALGREAGE